MEKNCKYIYWILVFCFVFLFLQYTYKFHFYYIEQLQLFLLSKKYAIEILSQPGGLTLYISRFLVQFFCLPAIGALTISSLLTLIGVLTQMMVEQLYTSRGTCLISLFCPALLMLCQLDINYNTQGTISFLFILVLLNGYRIINKSSIRLLAGIISIPVVFFLAGAIVSLFAFLLFLWEILNKKKQWYYSFVYFLEVALIVFVVIKQGWQGEIRMILLPDAYYEPLLKNQKIYYAWCALPITFILSCFLEQINFFSVKNTPLIIVLQVLPLFALFFLNNKYGQRLILKCEEQDFYLKHNQWDKIIETFPTEKNNLQLFNVLNLALAKEGILGDNLFSYHQHGNKTILSDWDNTVPQAIALCDIYYQIGDIAVSQKLAFEGMVSSLGGGNVRLLHRLIETNLIFGAYSVAEKYIYLLGKTLMYSNVAKEYSRFLYNDHELEQDSVLGGKRRSLISNNHYAVSNNVLRNLEQLAKNNPSNTLPIQYLSALYLTNKDLKNFRTMMGKYAKSKICPILSKSQQEAVVALEQESPLFWLQHGVSSKVEQRFRAFDTDMNNRQYGFQERMQARHGDTFWYYLLFVDIKNKR